MPGPGRYHTGLQWPIPCCKVRLVMEAAYESPLYVGGNLGGTAEFWPSSLTGDGGFIYAHPLPESDDAWSAVDGPEPWPDISITANINNRTEQSGISLYKEDMQ